MPYVLDFALRTDPGQVRPLNEDAVAADPEVGLFILADGLGGYNAGEIASTMAVSSLLANLTEAFARCREAGEVFDPPRTLSEALIAMNADIYRAALNSAAFEGMATTVVLAWLLGGQLWVAHTGDSRLYRYRAGALDQLTRDHSFSQELLDAGMVTEEEARLIPAKNLVTRALGAAADIEPEVHDYDVQDGDLLLLCSDGLTEMVTTYEIDGLVAACASDVHEIAHRLVDMANEAGGRDNVSVIVVRLMMQNEPAAAEDETAEDEAAEAGAVQGGVTAGAAAASEAAGNEAAEGEAAEGEAAEDRAGAEAAEEAAADGAGKGPDRSTSDQPDEPDSR